MLADVWELKHTTCLSQMVTENQLFPFFTFVHPATFILLSSFHSQRQIFVRAFCSFLSSRGVSIVPKIENNFFSYYHGPKPDLYKRYIDDCASVTSSCREGLLFITSVNSFLSALKYTWEISENSLPFLDIKLSINDNCLSTRVHYKRTDAHNYLLHWSCLLYTSPSPRDA